MICHCLPGPTSAGGADRQHLKIPQPSCSLQWRLKLSIQININKTPRGGGRRVEAVVSLSSSRSCSLDLRGRETTLGAIDWRRSTKNLLLCELKGSVSKCHVSVSRDKNTPRCLCLFLLPWQQRSTQILQLVAPSNLHFWLQFLAEVPSKNPSAWTQ